jgi:hypothetical protein
VAGVEHASLVLMPHQHGCLPGSSPGTSGSDRAVGGLAVSPKDVWRPCRPVLAPTCGPAGDAAGQAPPVGLAVQLGQVRHGQRGT